MLLSIVKELILSNGMIKFPHWNQLINARWVRYTGQARTNKKISASDNGVIKNPPDQSCQVD
jgi:hypothetical protein